ncbi:MAG: DUF2499 domain-containing protein [Chromatiaceae bacterium]|nr:DUF2499 domain-containing protein [Chromatiaceae bacterium]MCF8016445.1 DUF2499 domain-containing protein [Chromatiaceae bacterium]
MLLSVPTWIIHLLTVSEWLAAILLFRRYAIRIERPRLRWFAYAMIPHLLAGLAVLGFHLSGDQADGLIALSRLLTFVGSLSLLSATLLLLPEGRFPRGGAAAVVMLLGLPWGLLQWSFGEAGAIALLPAANLAYLGFLVMLLVLYRQDRALFSALTVFGFWFLLVFVAVTITTTRIATLRLVLPSLSHADLLHGASESLLSVSNFLIAFGVYRRLQATRVRPSEPACWSK